MGGDLPVDANWLMAALGQSSDLIVVIDEAATVKWASDAVRRLGGYEPSTLVGRSMVEFVHPEDLERAAEVLELAGENTFDSETPMTPALYRMLHSDGSWVQMEINATRSTSGETDLLLVIRQAGDLVLNDQLLEVVTAGGPFETQLDIVLELGRWRYPTDGYFVTCSSVDGDRLVRAAGLTDPRLQSLAAVDGPTPWDQAITCREPVVVRDLDDAQAITPELASAARHEGFESVLAVPVADPAHDDACLVVWSTPEGPSVSGQRYPMTNMARALALTLQWRAYRHGLERTANVDGLTGAVTRRRFFEVAAELFETGARAVLYIDLDHFKAVNDKYGHSAGDFVLATTAARFGDALGPDALLGRLGGDEFAVLCPPGTTSDDAERIAASIVETARRPIELRGGPVAVAASVGVAMRAPGEAIDAVLDRADRGLMATKAAGKDGWQVQA